MVLDFPGAYPFGVKRQDLILDAGDIFLVLLYDDGFEFTFPVAGYFQIYLAIVASKG